MTEMAWSPDDPLLWGGVFVLVFLLEVVIVLNLKSQKGKSHYRPPGREAVLKEGEELTDVLSRFVNDASGERIGESVGMDGDRVIVKTKKEPGYLAVPRSSLTEEADAFQVTGEVDWEQAARMGGQWKKDQHRLVEYSDEELPEDERSS